ncbi:MAG: hypothetical protein M3378_09120 [Actinomycetota bacterium]|nr:hypothetical protein [Actinomycetota bacterium]
MSQSVPVSSSVGEIDRPQFCPWCGTPSPYRSEPHTPLWQRAAEETGQEAPEAVRETLETEAFVTGCAGCRRVSHVVGHEADRA